MQMQLGLSGRQTCTPQMIASIAVLQCGTQELGEYLEEMSYENPMMELLEPPEAAEPLPLSFIDRLHALKAGDWQNKTYYTEEARESVDQYLCRDTGETLCTYLKEQIALLEVSGEMRAAMNAVAEMLDARGFYTGTAREIAEIADCSVSTAKDALLKVRTLDPPGVAAGSTAEALSAQLEGKPAAKRLVTEHFSHLGTWSDERLAEAMGLSPAAIAAAKADIRALNPYPSNGFASAEEIRYVTPDITITLTDGDARVAAEDGYIPAVHISPYYLRMLETEKDPEVQSYLRGKLRQLQQVMDNLGRRKSTLLRVGEVIADRQEAFFRGGTLRKLTLRETAEMLNLHESTVGRAVKNKYVQCDRGLFPMSAFFSRDAGQNAGVSRGEIQEEMQKIISAEDPKRPLSDEKIAGELGRRHILLSRRAVAKYRSELGIPPASARKHKAGI